MLVPESVTSATYDPANRQSTFADKTMTFDDSGNLVSLTTNGQTTTYTWDARNRLTGIGGPSMGASFAYDALGRRARKTINGQSTGFQYDGLDVAWRWAPPKRSRTSARWRSTKPSPGTDSTGTVTYLADALGSTVALTDGSGTTSTTYTTLPLGRHPSPVSRLPAPSSSRGVRMTGPGCTTIGRGTMIPRGVGS